MELTFEKVGNQYVAEFEAPSDFNLHIEREEIGVLEVHQRGSEEGKYDFAWSTGVSGRKVVDYDFGALVYPKWIKVVRGSEVVNASVNFNVGGGSGNGSEGTSNWKYIDVSNYTSLEKELISQALPQLVRLKVTDNQHFVICGGVLPYLDVEMLNMINAMAFDVSAKVSLGDGYDFVTVRESYDFMVKANMIKIPFDELVFITEEEFYSHPQ